MSREDIKKQFPDATEEQITAILNINGADIESEKKKNVDPKVLKQLQDDAAAAKAEFARKSSRLEVEKILVGAGLSEDDYKDLIDGLVSEDAEASKALATSLATMLGKQKEAAVQKTKEELMDGTQTPGGEGSVEEKAEDVKNIESITFGGVAKDAQSARDYYK